MNQLVADEVWANSGVIVPRVTVNFGGNDSWTDPTTVSAATPIRVDADATLINHGWTTITVTGFDVQLRNTSIATADSAPITLRPGQHVTVNLRFAIASCANTPGGRTPSLRVHVDRWWGTETATASMRGVPDVHDIRSDACRSMALS